jgi:hypothetical protein
MLWVKAYLKVFYIHCETGKSGVAVPSEGGALRGEVGNYPVTKNCLP